ncbi:MAG TPA: transporter substrate-binding protein [Desulfotomaculum sp.]|nr:transporter substrate-binding protein [Desulfotomaculum sp.]
MSLAGEKEGEPVPGGQDIHIGLLFSLTGTTSVTERGQYQSALLAIRQINENGGVLGRKLIPITEDIASDPILSAAKAEKLIHTHHVAAIIGLYTSVCRKLTIPVLEKYNKLLFYPTLYEGEELSPYVYYCGPVPNQQLETFIPWIFDHIGKSVYLVGSDYVYPRETNKHIRRLVKLHGGTIAGEQYVALGAQRFQQILREITAVKPNVVFSTLVGESVIAFYQQFYGIRLNIPIASAITAETEIQAMGINYAVGHYTSFPYFSSIRTKRNSEFRSLYNETYGTQTISAVMESAYYSVWLLAEGIRRARSTDTDEIREALRDIEFEAPQGCIRVDPKNQHLWLQSRIGRVNANGEFDIVWESNGLIPPIPFYNDEKENAALLRSDSASAPIHVLRTVQDQYKPLIDAIKNMTKYFPYRFGIFNAEGLTLAVFRHDVTDTPELPPFLSPGIKANHALIGHSGISLALMGRSEAVVRGSEHEREELKDWITIGIPIQRKSGRFYGVLGVFIDDYSLSPDTITTLSRALKQLLECAVGIVEEQGKKAEVDRLFVGAINAIPEGYISVANNEVLVKNQLASDWLADDPNLLPFLRSYLSSVQDQQFMTRFSRDQHVFEIKGQKIGEVYHIFIRKMRILSRKSQKNQVELVGSNVLFLKNIQLAELAAQADANVLLLGESGTGKELFARFIHNASPRRNKPFIAVNCAGLPRDLVSAELFGYEDGAFTGAKRGGRPGKFELANGGTLFLDEIGDMPIDQQAVLLRVLQEKEVVRVGSGTPIPVDVRIISATNKRLAQEIAYNGSFRSDLYFRLNVFTIELVPLRLRKDDIPELSRHFLTEFSEATGTPEKSLSEEATRVLMQYGWPGNVRELRNALERAFYVAGNEPLITLDHLPDYLRTDDTFQLISPEFEPKMPQGVQANMLSQGEIESIDSGVQGRRDEKLVQRDARLLRNVESIRLQYAQDERLEIERALMMYKGNISRTARELGISRTTLYRKLRDYKLI